MTLAGANVELGPPDPWQPRAGVCRLLVTTSYPRHPGDPAGGFVAARVQALIDTGETVHVLAAGDAADPPSTVDGSRLSIDRVPFGLARLPPLFYGGGAPEAVERTPAAAALQALRFWAGLVDRLAAALPSAQVVESHWLLPSALAVAACAQRPGMRLRSPPPHVAHAHSGDVALLERLPGGRALARWLLVRVNTVVLASEDLRLRLLHLAGDPPPGQPWPSLRVQPASSPLVVGPACRPVAPERVRLRRGRGLPRPVVLAIGRLVRIKGHDVLIRAVGRLPPDRRPTVAILGEGPERPALAALAAARGVDLRLVGEVGPQAVRDWLALAELLVHPSRPLASGRREGLPVAVREALSAQLPVIASATGGIPELAGSHPALLTLVPPEQPIALATAVDGHLHGTGGLPLPPVPAGVSQVSSA